MSNLSGKGGDVGSHEGQDIIEQIKLGIGYIQISKPSSVNLDSTTEVDDEQMANTSRYTNQLAKSKEMELLALDLNRSLIRVMRKMVETGSDSVNTSNLEQTTEADGVEMGNVTKNRT